MKSCVTISLVPEAKGGPFVFWDDLRHACETAGKLGYDAIEIFAPSPDELRNPDLPKLLSDNNLKLAAVGTGAGWVKHRLHLVLPEAADRRAANEFINSMIDAGGALGAPAIIGSMQGRWGDSVDRATAQVYLRESLQNLGRHANQYHVPLIFEPLNRYESNIATCMADGLKLIEESSSSNVVLLADLFHLNIEEADIAGTIRKLGDKVGHVHFVDSNRQAVGLGHLNMGPIIEALREIQYNGYLSAEALPLPTSEKAAAQTIRAFRYWTRTA